MKEADNYQLIFIRMFYGVESAVFFIGLETGPAAANEIM